MSRKYRKKSGCQFVRHRALDSSALLTHPNSSCAAHKLVLLKHSKPNRGMVDTASGNMDTGDKLCGTRTLGPTR
jgi:hypothetical protein